MLSIVLTVGASLGYLLSRSINSLLVFRTMEGASKGVLWPAAEAAVADTATGDTGKAMGNEELDQRETTSRGGMNVTCHASPSKGPG